MHYTWDEDKNRRNKAKHGVTFGDAVRIFEFETVERIDGRFDYGEERIIALGRAGPLILFVTYVERDEEERRIISSRRAQSHEKRFYWQELGLEARDGLEAPRGHERRRNPRRRS